MLYYSLLLSGLNLFFPRGPFLCKLFVQILVLSLISKWSLRIFSKVLLWKQWVVVSVKNRKLRIRSWVWIWTFVSEKLDFDHVQQIKSKPLQWHFSKQFYSMYRLKCMEFKKTWKWENAGEIQLGICSDSWGKAQGGKIFFAHLPHVRCTVSSPLSNNKMSI